MKCFGCKNTNDKIGILIAQLGTPKSPTAKDLRPYLREFLGDRRVIEKPRILWWLILNLIILVIRPKRSARLYKRIWTSEGSPLLVFTKSLTSKLQNEFKSIDSNIEVSFGMRYGEKKYRIETAIDDLLEKGCKRILLFNMYPQYSATTTASNYDSFFKHLLKRRYVPTVKVVEPYYDHPEYIEALTTMINEEYSKYDKRPQKLVLSYHGIPQEYVVKGDPYCCQCVSTTKALEKKLNFEKDEIIHTFQSRFGRDPWLQPYTDYTIDELPEKGIKDIAVFAPGFPTDCLETLDELGNEASEPFHEAGGETLRLIPCLNDHPRWIEAMKNIILEELGSWLDDKKKLTFASFSCPSKL